LTANAIASDSESNALSWKHYHLAAEARLNTIEVMRGTAMWPVERVEERCWKVLTKAAEKTGRLWRKYQKKEGLNTHFTYNIHNNLKSSK